MVDKAGALTPSSSVVVSKPDDMARLLRESCPEAARDFAIASHERACWGFDDERTIFWERVVDLLSACASVPTTIAA